MGAVPVGFFLRRLTGELGTLKVAQIFGYMGNGCVHVYGILLGASDLDQRQLRRRHSMQ